MPHPVAAIVLAARWTYVDGALRPRADAPLVVDDAIGPVVGHQVIRCNVLLYPSHKSRERIRFVATRATTAMAHAWKHVQARALPRVIDVSRKGWVTAWG